MTTTMIDRTLSDDERRGHKAARARRLTDPLAAKGRRHPADRIEREGRARRALFISGVAGFILLSSGIAVADTSSTGVTVLEPVQTTSEILVRDDYGHLYLVRQDSTADQNALKSLLKPHTRSRSS